MIHACCRTETQAGGIEINLELATELPRIDARQGQLQEVISNLIQNALDAMSVLPIDCSS
jgi:signal transduction histidine kinase